MRPFVPLAMVVAFATNLLAVLRPVASSDQAILYLGSPYYWILLALQLLFYFFAWMGSLLRGKGWIGKLLYIPAFLVNSNVSAVSGLISFFTGKQTTLWKRARRREELLS
jgi:hypothetical protein